MGKTSLMELILLIRHWEFFSTMQISRLDYYLCIIISNFLSCGCDVQQSITALFDVSGRHMKGIYHHETKRQRQIIKSKFQMFLFLSTDKNKEKYVFQITFNTSHFERWSVRLNSTYQRNDPSLLPSLNVTSKLHLKKKSKQDSKESNLTKFRSGIEMKKVFSPLFMLLHV